MTSEPDLPTGFQFTLRPRDQLVVATVTACCLAAMLVHWLLRGGYEGRLIEVERVIPGTVPYTVDINRAEWIEFTVLPGVGETLARRIVESREQQGPFRDLRDLDRVKGIGARTIERLRPYLRPVADVESAADVKSRGDGTMSPDRVKS